MQEAQLLGRTRSFRHRTPRSGRYDDSTRRTPGPAGRAIREAACPLFTRVHRCWCRSSKDVVTPPSSPSKAGLNNSTAGNCSSRPTTATPLPSAPPITLHSGCDMLLRAAGCACPGAAPATAEMAEVRAEAKQYAAVSERSLSTAWRLGQLGQLGLALLEGVPMTQKSLRRTNHT